MTFVVSFIAEKFIWSTKLKISQNSDKRDGALFSHVKFELKNVHKERHTLAKCLTNVLRYVCMFFCVCVLCVCVGARVSVCIRNLRL